jgi:hypothetical protein
MNWKLTKNEGNLAERREEITALAQELFNKITSLPKNIRGDEKTRTGIQILCWVPYSRNLMIIRIGEPSEAAQFFSVEKAVRVWERSYNTSGDCGNEELFEFPGAVFFSQGIGLVVSTSGLLGKENEAISRIIIASILLEFLPQEDFAWIFGDWGIEEEKEDPLYEEAYLNEFVMEYRK